MRIPFNGTGNRARWDVDESADAATLAWAVASTMRVRHLVRLRRREAIAATPLTGTRGRATSCIGTSCGTSPASSATTRVGDASPRNSTGTREQLELPTEVMRPSRGSRGQVMVMPLTSTWATTSAGAGVLLVE
jgi:hypothetical protein